MASLLQAIKGEPHVAEKICYAISKLASGFPPHADTTIMSQYTQTLVQVLLETTDRQVQFGAKLQGSAYEALNEVITYTANDQLELVTSLIDVILQRTSVILQVQPQGRDAQEAQIQVLGKLCAVLQVIVQRLTASDHYKKIVQERYADNLMQVLLQIQIRQDEIGRSTVQEEAMLCIGALTYACEGNFLRYMDSLYPIIERGLKNYQEIQVCEIAVGLVGDICRGIGSEISRYTDGIMNYLIENLKNPQVHRNIKPNIMVVFGDIALAVGDQFEKYFQVVMLMLVSAMKLSMSSTQAMDEDFIDYNNELRKGICEACSGIIQGMGPDKNLVLMKPQASVLMEFLAASYEATDMDGDSQKAAVALLGDIASSCGNIGLFTQPWVSNLIQKCRTSQDKALVENANYAYVAVKKVINQPITAK